MVFGGSANPLRGLHYENWFGLSPIFDACYLVWFAAGIRRAAHKDKRGMHRRIIRLGRRKENENIHMNRRAHTHHQGGQRTVLCYMFS